MKVKAALSATCTALAAIAVMAANAFSAEPPSYTKYPMQITGQLVSSTIEDLDGDGLKDIVAISLSTGKKGAKRIVSVFYQKKGGGFGQYPDQNWYLDHEAVVFDVGTVAAGQKKAIAFMTPEGLTIYQMTGRTFSTRPTLLIKSSSIFSQEDPLDLPRWPILIENAGGGADLAIIPSIERLAVYSNTGGGYKLASSMPLVTRTSFLDNPLTLNEGQLIITHKIPVVQKVPFNSRGSQDLMVAWDDNADIWLRKAGGFADTPVKFRPGLLDSSKKDSLDTAGVQAVDLDGDGRLDMVVTKMVGGVSQTKSLVFIYKRADDGSFPDKPTQTIMTEGVVGPRVIDVNGDGKMDLLLPSVKMGISNFINMITSRQINMTVGVYLQGNNGRFQDQPSKEKGVVFNLDISNMGKNAKPVMTMGKFTRTPGYGLIVASKSDKVSIYLPDRYSVLADNAGLTLSVAAPSEMAVQDLNGDGIDDIVMTYRKIKDQAGKLNVFLSK
jgi:hypothetical protein